MRILWVSNSRKSPTGYGNQTDLFVPLLKKAGHEIAIFAFYGQEAAPTQDADGIITFPRLQHPYGNDVVKAHCDYWRADVVITLINPWVLDAELYGGMNWLAWSPVEGEPVMPGDVGVLKSAKRIWAMSRHGQGQFLEAGFENVDYVPHGVDPNVFKPGDRAAARKRLGDLWKTDLEGRFVVAWNAANKGIPGRKGWYEGMKAFKAVCDLYPETRPLLYIHSERDGRFGMPLETIRQLVGIPTENVLYAPQYEYLAGMIPPWYLNDMYNVADVLLNPSHGEGFGIPIMEAQMAGCPVIATDCSAMSELVDESGFLVGVEPYLAVPGQMWAKPDQDELGNALINYASMFGDEEMRAQWSATARDFAMEYAAETVLNQYMLPVLEGWNAENVQRQSERAVMRMAARERADKAATDKSTDKSTDKAATDKSTDKAGLVPTEAGENGGWQDAL